MSSDRAARVLSAIREIRPELDRSAPEDRGRDAWIRLAERDLLPEPWMEAAPVRFAYDPHYSISCNKQEPTAAEVLRDWPLLPGPAVMAALDPGRLSRASLLAREFCARLATLGGEIEHG